MSEPPTIAIEMMFLTKEGGYDRLPDLTGYSPHLVVGESEYLGVVFLDDRWSGKPQEQFVAILGLIYHPNVDYSALVPGASLQFERGQKLLVEDEL
jgi:hypothetical protein